MIMVSVHIEEWVRKNRAALGDSESSVAEIGVVGVSDPQTAET
jgi:hypothetical protein